MPFTAKLGNDPAETLAMPCGGRGSKSSVVGTSEHLEPNTSAGAKRHLRAPAPRRDAGYRPAAHARVLNRVCSFRQQRGIRGVVVTCTCGMQGDPYRVGC